MSVLWYIWNGKLAAVDVWQVHRPCLTVIKSKIKTFISPQVVSCWSLNIKYGRHNKKKPSDYILYWKTPQFVAQIFLFFLIMEKTLITKMVTIMFNSYFCFWTKLPRYIGWNSWLAAEMIDIITRALYHSADLAYKWFHFCTYGGSENSFLTKTETQFIALVKASALILLNPRIMLPNVNCSNKSACNLGKCCVS